MGLSISKVNIEQWTENDVANAIKQYIGGNISQYEINIRENCVNGITLLNLGEQCSINNQQQQYTMMQDALISINITNVFHQSRLITEWKSILNINSNNNINKKKNNLSSPQPVVSQQQQQQQQRYMKTLNNNNDKTTGKTIEIIDLVGDSDNDSDDDSNYDSVQIVDYSDPDSKHNNGDDGSVNDNDINSSDYYEPNKQEGTKTSTKHQNALDEEELDSASHQKEAKKHTDENHHTPHATNSLAFASQNKTAANEGGNTIITPLAQTTVAMSIKSPKKVRLPEQNRVHFDIGSCSNNDSQIVTAAFAVAADEKLQHHQKNCNHSSRKLIKLERKQISTEKEIYIDIPAPPVQKLVYDKAVAVGGNNKDNNRNDNKKKQPVLFRKLKPVMEFIEDNTTKNKTSILTKSSSLQQHKDCIIPLKPSQDHDVAKKTMTAEVVENVDKKMTDKNNNNNNVQLTKQQNSNLMKLQGHNIVGRKPPPQPTKPDDNHVSLSSSESDDEDDDSTFVIEEEVDDEKLDAEENVEGVGENQWSNRKIAKMKLSTKRWEEHYNEVQDYYNKHGGHWDNINKNDDDDNKAMNNWIRKQRYYYNQHISGNVDKNNLLTNERINRLKKFGIFENLIFYNTKKRRSSNDNINSNNNKNKINDKQQQMNKKYKTINNTSNNMDDNINGKNNALTSQQQPNKIKETKHDIRWNDNFNDLCIYYKNNKHFNVSEDEFLGRWIRRQIEEYNKNKLNQNRYNKLKSIGFFFC